MTLYDIFHNIRYMEIKDAVTLLFLVFIILSTVIEIAPIKINPWDAILKWIGDRLNKSAYMKIEEVEKKLDKHIKESNERDATDRENQLKQKRKDITCFCNECMRGKKHTLEQFNLMMGECDEYEIYVRDNHIVNGVINSSISEIRRLYNKCIENNDFLIEGNDDANSSRSND